MKYSDLFCFVRIIIIIILLKWYLFIFDLMVESNCLEDRFAMILLVEYVYNE
ncbi:hypothetical protein Fmac_008435 [Flemingia macrophylla]|uniref:Uncharacterized protein n=1 Tax=Flemingia macrophylla TaxID=520843 RepID=A0ABD1MXF2_9FABA